MRVYLVVKERYNYDDYVKIEHKIFAYKENAEQEIANQTELHKKYHEARKDYDSIEIRNQIRSLPRDERTKPVKALLDLHNIEYVSDSELDDGGYETSYYLEYIVEHCWNFSIVEMDLDFGVLG